MVGEGDRARPALRQPPGGRFGEHVDPEAIAQRRPHGIGGERRRKRPGFPEKGLQPGSILDREHHVGRLRHQHRREQEGQQSYRGSWVPARCAAMASISAFSRARLAMARRM